MTDNNKKDHHPDAHLDPITQQPGARPVGTGLGAATAGVVATAAGAAIGGPIGAVVGAAVGAVGGGLLGKSIAETIDPTVEYTYWEYNYRNRPYVEPGYGYDDYSPAYRIGYEGYSTYSAQGLSYDEAEPHLKENYEHNSGYRLGWDKAQYASRDAWERAERAATAYRTENDYWRDSYASRPYMDARYNYEDYKPAYRVGYDGYDIYSNQRMSFAEAEPHLRRDYERRYSDSQMGWDQAKHAVQDAWNRAESIAKGHHGSHR